MKRDFIGASDIPILLGLDPYNTEEDLVARILHDIQKEKSPELQAMADRGTKAEPGLLSSYEAVFGVLLERKFRQAHPEYPFIGAAPDGVWLPDRRVLVECKTRHRRAQMAKDPAKKFGWAGSADVPAKYAAQCQLQMECCDADECQMWVAFGEDLEDGSWRTDWLARYVLPRDRDFGANLVAVAVDFWTRRIAPFRAEAA